MHRAARLTVQTCQTVRLCREKIVQKTVHIALTVMVLRCSSQGDMLAAVKAGLRASGRSFRR